MLRGLVMISITAGSAGCLWEPVQLAPDAGNADAAPIIQTVSPSGNQLFLSTFGGDPCVAEVTLFSVYSPRGEPLQASFFLNFDPPKNVNPLSIDGQTQFDLQGSQGVYSLATLQIRIDEFASQLNGQINVLQVFVSDDLANCPNPLTAPSPSSSGNQLLPCYTTQWVWAIEPVRCSIQGF
jgi:hypothetical protein